MGIPDEERVVDLADDDVPLLPTRTADDTDEGWSESRGQNVNDFRLLEDRPPHWG